MLSHGTAYKPAASNGAVTRGFLFFPDQFIDSRAYAPTLKMVADEGFLVFGIDLEPFRMPSIAINMGLLHLIPGVFSDFSFIEKWAIGGHGLGMELATQGVVKFYDPRIVGLVAWSGQISPEVINPHVNKLGHSFPILDIKVPNDLMIQRTGVAKKLFFDNITTEVIEGGIHDGYGSYSAQALPDKQRERGITAERQRRRAADATVGFLSRL